MSVQLFLLAAGCLLVGRVPAGGAEALDSYGGLMEVAGHPGESFHLEKIGRRWWLVTPEGHGMFIRAVSKVDTSDYGGSGGFQAYDGVCLQPAGSAPSPNLQSAAANTVPRDVVHPASGVSLQAKGDALYLGSSSFRPNFSYFWLDRLGEGGKLDWYYSTADGWKLVRGNGRPLKGEKLSAGGGWCLDTGKYMAPDAQGFGKWDNPNANRITWWDMAEGFPADFAPVALPNDPTRRYYLKAVVTQDFVTPPVLNQVYERADLIEGLARKHGPGDFLNQWAVATTQRLKGWGFNAAGQYSYQYVAKSSGLKERLPAEPTWALGGWATSKDRPYHVKNVYAGVVFPPGSKSLVYQGLQPDVFEPGCKRAYLELVAKAGTGKDPWCWALICEEADYLFGINSLTHDHMGYVVLAQNPYQPQAVRDGQTITYEEKRLFAKYALRDFLRDRHRAAGDPLPAFSGGSRVPAYTYARTPAGQELAALQSLNAAWGTRYTTWDTSAGDLLQGNNAWGTGTGFMDENGKGVVALGVRSPGFDKQFTDPAHPAIRKDLDDFLGLFADRYGRILQAAFAQGPHPLLLLPIYNGPECVYKALAPYVDGFWVSVTRPEDALRIYNAGHKPLLVADYLTADPDSPWYFKVAIGQVRYDADSGSTFITAPGLRWAFRLEQFVTFPDAPEVTESYRRVGKPYPSPRVKSVQWDTVSIPGDYTQFLKPGMHLELFKNEGYRYRTQEERAKAMTQLYEALLNLRGDDGMTFVLGVEHWCLYDPAVSNWCDNRNFGLVTFLDNAYDGTEARRATAVDARGCPVGGEDADYGNLLRPLGEFLRGLDGRLAAEK